MYDERKCFNLFIIPIVVDILRAILFTCSSHFRCSSTIIPRKLNVEVCSICAISTDIEILIIFSVAYETSCI